MKLIEILNNIQIELKSPKSQFNKFGGYAYRSTEDILEGLKPLLKKYKAVLTISDEIEARGSCNYIKATVTLIVADEKISVNGWAKESESQKGMSASQITGATSSYARKYALNGLFAIDDTQDADATNTHGKEPNQPKTHAELQNSNEPTINQAQLGDLSQLIGVLNQLDEKAVSGFLNAFKIQQLRDLKVSKFESAIKSLNAKISKLKQEVA